MASKTRNHRRNLRQQTKRTVHRQTSSRGKQRTLQTGGGFTQIDQYNLKPYNKGISLTPKQLADDINKDVGSSQYLDDQGDLYFVVDQIHAPKQQFYIVPTDANKDPVYLNLDNSMSGQLQSAYNYSKNAASSFLSDKFSTTAQKIQKLIDEKKS